MEGVGGSVLRVPKKGGGVIARGFYTPALGVRQGLLLGAAREETGVALGQEPTTADVEAILAWLRARVKVATPEMPLSSPADVVEGGKAEDWQMRHTFSWLCMEGFGIPVTTRALRHTDGVARLDVVLVGGREWVVEPASGLFPKGDGGQALSLAQAQASPDLIRDTGAWVGSDGRGAEGFFRPGSDFFTDLVLGETTTPQSTQWLDDTP